MRRLALLTSLALAGSAGAQSPTLTGTTWTLTGLTETGGQLAVPGTAAPRPTLRLDGRNASGSTGCNIYRANYVTRADLLSFGPLATTRRACPDYLDGLEERFVNLMSQVTRYRLSGTTLTLLAGSRDRLVFTAGPTAAIPARPEVTVNLDGTWTLSGGTALRPVAGNVPELTFAGGRLSGTGGCNRLMGSFRLEGETLTPGPVASTRMACAPGVNAQETAFLTFLGGPLTVSLQPQVLTLTNAAGRTLVFRRAGLTGGAGLREGGVGATRPQPQAAEGRYTLAAVNGQPAPRTAQPVTLVLEAGRIGGSDGCNSFGGAYRLAGGRVVLAGPLVSTLRACPDEAGTVDLPALLRTRPALTVTAAGLSLTGEGTTLEFTHTAR